MKNPNARKKRQLKQLAEQLHQLIVNSGGSTTPQIKKVLAKMKALVQELRQRISATELKKVLGAAALFFGLTAAQQAAAQNFLPPVPAPFGLTNGYGIAAITCGDIDNDGDIDVMMGEYDGTIRYFENTGTPTAPAFAAAVINPFGLDSTNQFALPELADMDNDGDLDLLVGEYYGNMQYFENTGTLTTPNFTAPVQNPFNLQQAYYFGHPAIADLDNDGDMDILIGEYYGNMNYYQNTGTPTTPSMAAPVQNAFGLSPTYAYAFIDFGDLDNDGDFDLMTAEGYGAFQYYENTGSPTAPSLDLQQTNPFGLDTVANTPFAMPEFVDLDGDGDLDMLVGAYYGAVYYYENGVPSDIPEAKPSFELTIFPNPVRDVLRFATSDQITQIEILDLSGRMINLQQNVNNTIGVAHLPKGIYLVRLTNDEGLMSVKKFNKR